MNILEVMKFYSGLLCFAKKIDADLIFYEISAWRKIQNFLL